MIIHLRFAYQVRAWKAATNSKTDRAAEAEAKKSFPDTTS